MVKFGEKSMLLRGYQNYNTFNAVINQLTNGEIQEVKLQPTEENVLNFINKYDSLAPVEIKMPFDLSDAELDKIINSLQEKKLVAKRVAGNGYFISPLNNPMMCDVDSGMCGI